MDLWCLCIHPLGKGAHGSRRETNFVVRLGSEDLEIEVELGLGESFI